MKKFRKYLTILCVISVLLCAAAAAAEIASVKSETDQVTVEAEGTDAVKVTYNGAQNGKQYLVLARSGEEGPPTKDNIIYLDQTDAEGAANGSASFTVRPDTSKLTDGTYYVYLSSNADDGIQELTKVASFTIGGGSETPAGTGDLDGSGKANGKDLATLARYVAKWDGYSESDIGNFAAADVNGDGKVNGKDIAVLARHIAKWPGYETLPLVSGS